MLVKNTLSVLVAPGTKPQLARLAKSSGFTISHIVRLSLEAGLPEIEKRISALRPTPERRSA
jgi:predicted DNA-binding protein